MDKINIVSDENIKIYEDNFNFKVFAGPGAGKTHFLIKNIIETIKNSKKLLDENRKILCITYTNVAADEIKERLGDYRKYVYVSTIHSFLWEYVIKPFQVQLKKIIKDIYNIDIPEDTKFQPRIEGFGLLSKVKKSEFIKILQEKHNLRYAEDISLKKLGEVILNIKDINTYPIKEEAPRVKIVKDISETDALKIKTAIWQEEGVLDFDEILYFSYVLLKQYKFIPYSIRFTFPYILIDEYQDTNPMQNAMIKIISENKNVSVGVVGDIAQSIYGFQGATYKEFLNYSSDVKEFREYIIDGNRRSNINIVNFLNYVRQNDKKLTRQKNIKNTENMEKVHFVLCKGDIDILSKLNHSDPIVLCRRWQDVFTYIQNVGPDQKLCLKKIHSFYNFVLERDLTKDFEENRINWINQIKMIVNVKEAIIKRDLYKIIQELSNIFKLDLFNDKTKSHKVDEYKKLMDFLKVFYEFNGDSKYEDIVKSINEKIDQSGLEILNKLELIEYDDENYILNFNPYLYQLTYNTLKIMVEQIFTQNSRYVTIHRTKGKEYNTVFVNLEPVAKEKDLINIIEALENPVIIEDESYDATEFVRIAYVAFSRAINNLYIHLKCEKEDISNMIKNIDDYIEKENIEKFYDIIDLNV